MMDFISVPLITGIVFAAIYGLFELFVRRKERLTLIEKLGDKLDISGFENKLGFTGYMSRFSFSSLKVGCLLMGVGLGLLVGFFINLSLLNNSGGDHWRHNDMIEVAYGASVLLFGGIGLLIAFIVEMKLSKNK